MWIKVELGTLDSTVKLLERQKGEAQKRLDDLDNQVCMNISWMTRCLQLMEFIYFSE